MKALFFTIAVLLSAPLLKAQNKAQQDNNQFIAVTQTQATTGKNNPVHYKLTNNNSVSMDFSLYKEMKNGSWDVTRHLDLKPGQAYEDVTGFTGYTGKYVVYSAPHADWASFPSAADLPGLQNAMAGAQPPPPPAPPTGAAAQPAPAATPKP